MSLKALAGYNRVGLTGAEAVSNANVERVLREVGTLNSEERQQLLAILKDGQNGAIAATADALVEEALRGKGIIGQIPASPTEADVAAYDSIVPVSVEGKPLSDSLIEDRR
jgi:hypothetical protein